MDHFNLEGKTALVTGGSRGIGRAVVNRLAQAGANVLFTYQKNKQAAKQTADSTINTVSFKADISNPEEAQEAVAKTISQFGALDILVLNAGITRDNLIWKQSIADFDAVLDTNLRGAFVTLRAAASHLRENRWGKVVFISSINGIRGKAGQGAYAASKGGLIAFGKSMAKELGRRNINVNLVAPGLIKTDMTNTLPRNVLDTALGETAINRLGTPEDVANAVLFLASDLARHITGQVLNVDGGQLI